MIIYFVNNVLFFCLDEEIKKLEAELKVLEKEGVKPCTPEESQQLKSEIAQLKSEVESVDETVKYKQDVMDNYEIKCSQLHATVTIALFDVTKLNVVFF